MEELLRYDHVDISYLGQPVIRDVSFSLHSGEILGIVGESGSGKSTLIKAAMGLLGCEGQVTRGDIWFKGKNLPELPPKELRKLCGPELGYIFQNAGSSFCPIPALDVTIQKQVVEEMLMVRETFGTAIVLVTHNLGVIGAMADRVLVLENGRCVECGSTRQVLSQPCADYTKALLAAVPRLRR